jgi:hypothetical protein
MTARTRIIDGRPTVENVNKTERLTPCNQMPSLSEESIHLASLKSDPRGRASLAFTYFFPILTHVRMHNHSDLPKSGPRKAFRSN